MIVTALILTFCVVAAIWIYNQLVKDRNQVEAAWSDIDVQLVRRHDLVPQLVSAVKAYADYEQASFEAITQLRAQAAAVSEPAKKAPLEDSLNWRLHQLILVAEDYPDLQADENFQQLQTALTETEDHLQYARRFYNGSVRALNTRVASFPHLLIAQAFGFSAAQFFEAEDDSRQSPKVDLN